MQENFLNLNKSGANLWHLNQDLLLPAPVQNDDGSTPGMYRWEHKFPSLPSSQLNGQASHISHVPPDSSTLL